MRLWTGKANFRAEIGFWKSTLLSRYGPVHTEFWTHPIKGIWGIAFGRWMVTVIHADRPRADCRSDRAAFDHAITKVQP